MSGSFALSPSTTAPLASRYDYREAWLTFLGLLAGEQEGEERDVATRVLHAVLSITRCRAGCLWRVEGDGSFVWRAGIGVPPAGRLVVAAPDVARALPRECVVLDRRDLASASGGGLPGWLAAGFGLWAAVALAHCREPLALLLLAPPQPSRELDAEDRALLSTLARAAVSALAEAEARRSLEEMRALEAFNRRVAFVLHDIKNVAAKLSLALDNARRLQGNPEFYEDLLGTLAHAVRRLETLRARLEVQPATSRDEPVPLHRLVRRACARIGPVLALAEPLPEVWLRGDGAALEAAIGDLLANAREAAGEGGRVEVRLLRRGFEALLEIRDSGPGIPHELVAAGLFRPFLTGRAGGTGLGLFAARDAVQRAGGRIEIERDRGTVVRLRLPLAERDQ